jgi:AraC-like DNA-binding protein
MQHDALSSTLRLIDARATYAGGLVAGGAWAIRFPPPKTVKFFTIGRGSCQFAVDGAEPIHLQTGDVVLLAAEAGFVLSTAGQGDPIDAVVLFADRAGEIVTVGAGDEFLFLGCHLDLDDAGGRLLLDNLPPVIHLAVRDAGAGQLQWLIRELVDEVMSSRTGTYMARTNLAQLMFLQIMRRFLGGETGVPTGWIRAACDLRLAPVLRLMHGDPARNWTLPELARHAGMSRTAFATHFRRVAGVPPMTYLAQWRLRQAERCLRDRSGSVASVARSVGYESVAAFSTAFKRLFGHAPRHASGHAAVNADLPTESPNIGA